MSMNNLWSNINLTQQFAHVLNSSLSHMGCLSTKKVCIVLYCIVLYCGVIVSISIRTIMTTVTITNAFIINYYHYYYYYYYQLFLIIIINYYYYYYQVSDSFLQHQGFRHKRLAHLFRDVDYILTSPVACLRILAGVRDNGMVSCCSSSSISRSSSSSMYVYIFVVFILCYTIYIIAVLYYVIIII